MTLLHDVFSAASVYLAAMLTIGGVCAGLVSIANRANPRFRTQQRRWAAWKAGRHDL